MLYAPFIPQYDGSSVLSYVPQFPNQHFNQFPPAFPNQFYALQGYNNNNQQFSENARETQVKQPGQNAQPAIMMNQSALPALRVPLLLRAPQSTVNLHFYYNNNCEDGYYQNQNTEPNHQFRPSQAIVYYVQEGTENWSINNEYELQTMYEDFSRYVNASEA